MSCHEPYLIERISDVRYHIDQGKLAKKQIDRMRRPVNCILQFYGEPPLQVPEEYASFVKSRKGAACLMAVPKEQSQPVILKMIQSGWQLRRMTDDRIS